MALEAIYKPSRRLPCNRLTLYAEKVPYMDDNAAEAQAIRTTKKYPEDISQCWLAAIIESSEDAIVSMMLNGTIISWNESAERLFGYSRDEAVGQNISFLVPSEMEDEQRDINMRVQAGDHIKRFETVRIDKTGRYIDINLTLSPVRDAAGQIIGTSMIAQDITTHKITKSYLKELDDCNQKLAEFSSIRAHQLKGPLRGLSYLSSILQEDYAEKLGAKGTERLNVLVALCQRMDTLIDNLFYFSKLENEKSAVQNVNLDEIIKDIQQEMRSVLKEKNARIVIPHLLPFVTGDKARIADVFRNLIANAVNYNDKIEPVVEIGFLESLQTRSGREENVFYIKDNGMGIEPKYHRLIFTMFKRLPSSVEDNKSGTGAGLAFVRKIIEHHNGRIWVESEPGKGSTFYFTLNRKEATGAPKLTGHKA